MIASEGPTKHIYSGNGSQRNWTYTFPITDPTDIKVYLTDPVGAETLLTSNYEVETGNSRVVYPTVVSGLDPLPSGWKITLLRQVPKTQLLDLVSQGSFNAENIETAFDKTVMGLQQLQEQLDRSLQYPVSSEEGSGASEFLADVLQAVSDAQAAQTAAETAETNAETAETNAEAAQALAEAAVTAAQAQAARLSGTSTSSLLIEVASKTFTTQSGKLFEDGSWVLIYSYADPTNYMHGQVTSYIGTELIVNVTNVGGSGTHSDWVITVAGTRGAVGPTGATGATGPAATTPVVDLGSISGTNNLPNTDTHYKATLTNNTTLTLPTPASGTHFTIIFEFTMASSYTVTVPGSVTWNFGAIPTIATTVKNVMTFETIDGGTTWKGYYAQF